MLSLLTDDTIQNVNFDLMVRQSKNLRTSDIEKDMNWYRNKRKKLNISIPL